MEHKQIAFIYGDGSNFGQITKNLQSLSQSLQWTNRASAVIESATILALGRAIGEVQENNTDLSFQYAPFEVLVMGGDDFSLFCWSGLAMRFCQHFLQLTDLEFAKGSGDSRLAEDKPICFGIGCLISDEKAPVRETVRFTGDVLLKWAKKPVNCLRQGAVAFLFTTSADQIPADFEAFIERAYIARRSGNTPNEQPVYLTLRPMTHSQLDKLITASYAVRDEIGTLQRLVEPFVDGLLLPAILHYLYQQARAEKRNQSGRDTLYTRIADMFGGAPVVQLNHPPLGNETQGEAFFVPLIDLLEITKSLR